MLTNSKGKELILFNLESGTTNPILGAGMDWIDEFSNHFQHVQVWSTRVGKLALNSQKISYHEVGGGTVFHRIRAVVRLFKLATSIVRSPANKVVLYHMSHKPAVILGPFLRMFSVPQGLWYSHSKNSISLKASSYFVNQIFTTNASTFPFQTSKLRIVGHGINIGKFKSPNFMGSRSDVVCLGRVAPVKNLEKIVSAVPKSLIGTLSVDFVGPAVDFEYRDYLEKLSLSQGLNVRFKGQIPFEEVPDLLRNYNLCFTGTPKSVDKAALEAALSGCFIVSDELTTLEQLGMYQVWKRLQFNAIPELPEQIEILCALPVSAASELRALLSLNASVLNDLKITARRIVEALNG